MRLRGQVVRKYPWGTQGRPDLCFGGFGTYGEPDYPLSLTQPSGAIQDTGPFFTLRYFAFHLQCAFVLLHVWCAVSPLQSRMHACFNPRGAFAFLDEWFEGRFPSATKKFIANIVPQPKPMSAQTETTKSRRRRAMGVGTVLVGTLEETDWLCRATGVGTELVGTQKKRTGSVHLLIAINLLLAYPPPPLSKLRPCPSYSRRRDRINLVPNFNSVPNLVQPHKTWV